jgi:hypothetical protein
MPLARRALFAAPFALLPPAPARAASAVLRPGQPSAIGFVPLPDERVGFSATGLGRAVTLPAPRARLATLVPMADRTLALLTFGADPPRSQARLDLAALVGWDGAMLRVLGLEVLFWQLAPRCAWLGTRIFATPDRSLVLLQRDAGAPRGNRPWQREHWIDRLAWQDGGPLADAPVRPPLPQTWQARLAAVRARVAARLVTPCQDIGEDVLALIAPADLPPV